jgi:hypothetical protein
MPIDSFDGAILVPAGVNNNDSRFEDNPESLTTRSLFFSHGPAFFKANRSSFPHFLESMRLRLTANCLVRREAFCRAN